MRILDGLEMMCFGRTKQFELEYGGKGKYIDGKGEPVTDVMDMACYVCTASYYTRDTDPIPFCPSCGVFEKKRFNDQKEISEFLRGQTFKWLHAKGLKAFVVKKMDNTWELRFARQSSDLERSGAYDKVMNIG